MIQFVLHGLATRYRVRGRPRDGDERSSAYATRRAPVEGSDADDAAHDSGVLVADAPSLAELDTAPAIDGNDVLDEGIDGWRKAGPRGHGRDAEGHFEFVWPDGSDEKGNTESDHEA